MILTTLNCEVGSNRLASNRKPMPIGTRCTDRALSDGQGLSLKKGPHQDVWRQFGVHPPEPRVILTESQRLDDGRLQTLATWATCVCLWHHRAPSQLLRGSRGCSIEWTT